jgi:hypothetical protein
MGAAILKAIQDNVPVYLSSEYINPIHHCKS